MEDGFNRCAQFFVFLLLKLFTGLEIFQLFLFFSHWLVRLCVFKIMEPLDHAGRWHVDAVWPTVHLLRSSFPFRSLSTSPLRARSPTMVTARGLGFRCDGRRRTVMPLRRAFVFPRAVSLPATFVRRPSFFLILINSRSVAITFGALIKPLFTSITLENGGSFLYMLSNFLERARS